VLNRRSKFVVETVVGDLPAFELFPFFC